MKRSFMAFTCTIIMIAVLSIGNIAFAKDDNKFKTNDMFGLLKNMFSASANLEPSYVDKLLKEYNFNKDGDTWKLSDNSGIVIIYVFKDSYIIRYMPRNTSPFSSNVLSALIEKSTSINIESADEISLYLGKKSLSDRTRTGVLGEWLKFSIPSGVWVETSITIKWE